MQPIVTPEIETVLLRYVQIQAEERELQDEKRGLQQKLSEHLRTFPRRDWQVPVGDRVVKVTHGESTRIEYNEETLAARLGERYLDILSVDPKKLRQQGRLVESYLRPVLTQVGSPDRERIREGIERGLFTLEDFKGTFTKTVKLLISVSVQPASAQTSSL